MDFRVFSLIFPMLNAGASSKRFFSLLSKPENAFIILGTVFGLLFVFVTPPALVGDEPNHFFRAYQISEGNIIGEKRGDLSGGWIPKSVLYTNRKLVGDIEMNQDVKFDTNLFSEFISFPLNDEDKVFERFPNTVIYTPIPYIPQVAGILVGKIFNASPLLMIYLSRICNLLFFLFLAFFAIKKTPVHKWVFCLLCLTPTNVFQVASASVDAFTYGICFLAIAYFLFYALEEVRLNNADILKLFILSLLAVLSKNAYIFLPALFLIIPRRKFSSTRNYLLAFAALLAVCVGSLALWSYLIKPIYLPYRIDTQMFPEEQAKFIISKPFNFIKMAAFDYISNSKYYFKTFFGQLTWFDLYVPISLSIFVAFVTTGTALLDKNKKLIVPDSFKVIFAFIAAATAFLISALLYITWTPLQSGGIEGIQGRYFIPVAPLIFLLFYNKKVKWESFEKYAHIIVYAAVIISLTVTLNTIINRYYI